MGLQILTERRNEQIAGVLSRYDRILIQGTLPGVVMPKRTGYLRACQIRIFDYTEWVQPLHEVLRNHA